MIRLLALTFLGIVSVKAQITNLAAPGNGSDLYYAMQAEGDACCPVGSIYKVGSGPATLVTTFPSPVTPAIPPPTAMESAWLITPYYLVSQPQVSRDRRV